jgi:hypothetical protein
VQVGAGSYLPNAALCTHAFEYPQLYLLLLPAQAALTQHCLPFAHPHFQHAVQQGASSRLPVACQLQPPLLQRRHCLHQAAVAAVLLAYLQELWVFC